MEPQYTDPDYHIYSYEPPPSRRGRRVALGIIALLMALVLVCSLAYRAQTLLPWILGYWSSAYNVTLTEVSNGNCRVGPRSLEGIGQGREYCVCGYLDAQQGTAHVNIHLETPNGLRLGTAALDDQSTGRFCQAIFLEDHLDAGIYRLVVTPRLSTERLARFSFRVQDTRPDL